MTDSKLLDPKFTPILMAIMVKRLGGSVLISQSDINDVAYNQLVEEGLETGEIQFRLVVRGKSS